MAEERTSTYAERLDTAKLDLFDIISDGTVGYGPDEQRAKAFVTALADVAVAAKGLVGQIDVALMGLVTDTVPVDPDTILARFGEV